MFGEWQWQAMWDALPPGFRFHPTDQESVDHYLTNYISGNRDKVLVIPVVDNIFKRDPSELPFLFRRSSIIRSRDPEWWFLSTLEYKSSHNNKFDRSTGKGSWKITGIPKKIYGRGENRQIAEMRNLVFCENPRNEETTWVIHEYNLKDNSIELTLRDQRKYVLCHLVNKKYHYTDMTTNMEVDLEFEECEQGFSEEVIEAKIRSLREVLHTPAATDSSLQNPRESCGVSLGTREVGPVNHQFREMEQGMSTNSGDQDSMLELLNYVDFDTDEDIAYLLDFEETSASASAGTTSNQAVLKENRQARQPGSLEGYVFIDESSGFVEDDFQREETGNGSTLTDLPKAPPSTKYLVTSPDEHPVGYSRRMEPPRSAGFLGTDHRSTPAIEGRRQEGKAKGGSLTGEVRGKKGLGTWTWIERAGNEDRSRPPFDYLVNLAVGMILLLLMILWARALCQT